MLVPSCMQTKRAIRLYKFDIKINRTSKNKGLCSIGACSDVFLQCYKMTLNSMITDRKTVCEHTRRSHENGEYGLVMIIRLAASLV